MIYGYASDTNDELEEQQQIFQKYSEEKSICIDQIIHDENVSKVYWEKRKIHALLTNAKSGDEIIVNEASDLARSTLQVIEILNFIAKRGLVLHLIKYSQVFTPEKVYDTEKFLLLMRCIEGEFVAKRTTDALNRRRAAGLPLGRPKGRKNKSRKLDKHRQEIKKYLALNINKASIAKLVGCHAQTLYNYLEDTNLMAEVDLERKELVASASQEKPIGDA